MFPRSLRRLASAVLLLSTATVLAACGSDSPSAPSPAPVLPPLVEATWYAHTAEGQELPALVAHRLEQGALVQEFLDSAQFHVAANGRFTRRLWLSRYRNGALEARVPAQETGAWAATDTAYIFTADVSGARFSLRALTPGQVVSVPLRAVANGYIAATVRVVPPTEPVLGTFRVTTVRGMQVPAAMYVFNDYVEGNDTMSVHLIVDSTRLVLRGNRQYEHVIHYSEWVGPNRGAPERRRYSATRGDFGEWTRTGTLLQFESGWLQNHRFAGTVYNSTAMELLHGLSHGDDVVPVRYARVEDAALAR